MWDNKKCKESEQALFWAAITPTIPINGTQKGKKNEKDFLGKEGRMLKYQYLSIKLICSEERQ